MDRDYVGEVAKELKLSRRKVLAVLDLWEAKMGEDAAERRMFIRTHSMELFKKLRSMTAFGVSP